MIFKLFEHDKPIKTRYNPDNIYASLFDAKNKLRLYLARINRKITDKNLQLKAEDCDIVGFELIEKERYKL